MSEITRLASLLALLFAFSISYSQDITIGSQKPIQGSHTVNDTVRLNSIIAAMDKTVGFSKECMALNNQLLPIFTKGLKLKNLHPKVKNKYLHAAGAYYYNIAKKETNDGDDKAPVHFDEAIKYLKASKDYNAMSQALVGKGTYYRRIADWPNTFKCFFAALKYYESAQYESGLSTLNMELGTTAIMQRDYAKGIVYLKKALPYYDKPPANLTIGDRHEIAVIHNNIGSAYTHLKNYPEAHKCYLKAYEIIKMNNDPRSESSILVQLANSSNDLGNAAEAQDYFKKALALSKDEISKMDIYGNAAVISYKSKNYPQAAEYGELSYAIGKKLRDLRAMAGLSKLLYLAYKKTGQYDKALKMHEDLVTIKDSTSLESSKNEFAQQQLKYDFEKKELQQKILQQKELTAVELDREKKVSSIRLASQKKTAREKSKSRLAQQQLKYDFERKEMKQKLIAEKKAAAKNNWLIGLSGILLALILGVYFYYRNQPAEAGDSCT
ncbi:MAG: tetratricopeptide repeat protein [Flavobacterium sp. JAD_PAG50586_2]|nr:MAG: tetratricopeptide repeat protein [Flavobacterium sp. JAD_PAG50586_2]